MEFDRDRGRSFGELLEFHLKNGTRPKGNPSLVGEEWKSAEFAKKLGTHERNVRNWRGGRNLPVPTMLNDICLALFGDNPLYATLKLELIQSVDNDERRTPKTISKSSTPYNSKCFVKVPVLDGFKEDLSRPRKRRPGRINSTMFRDGSDYWFTKLAPGLWPTDRPNRALSFASIEDHGFELWDEWNLNKVHLDGSCTWRRMENLKWMEVAAPGNFEGVLLRRYEPTFQEGDKIKLLEALIPIQRSPKGFSVNYRWSYFDPSERIDEKFWVNFVPDDRPFNVVGGDISIICVD